MFIGFLEREEGGGDRDRNIDLLPPVCALTRDWTHILGMCPGWGSNHNLFGVWDDGPAYWATPARASCCVLIIEQDVLLVVLLAVITPPLRLSTACCSFRSTQTLLPASVITPSSGLLSFARTLYHLVIIDHCDIIYLLMSHHVHPAKLKGHWRQRLFLRTDLSCSCWSVKINVSCSKSPSFKLNCDLFSIAVKKSSCWRDSNKGFWKPYLFFLLEFYVGIRKWCHLLDNQFNSYICHWSLLKEKWN